MDNYVEQLEKQNEELKELLAMKEEDADLINLFAPFWVETCGSNGVEYSYYIRIVADNEFTTWTKNKGIQLERMLLGTVKLSKGISANKVWVATSRHHDFMEFFESDVDAKCEIQVMWRNKFLHLRRQSFE